MQGHRARATRWGVVAAVVAASLGMSPLGASAAGGQEARSLGVGNPPTVALTFDDGPSPWTPALLDTLRYYGVPATFFAIGANAARYPDLVRRTVAEGHSVGGHTWTHPRLTSLGNDAIRAQVGETDRYLESLTGRTVSCVRPPYGLRNSRVLSIFGELGVNSLMWSVDARDWERPPASVIAARVLARTQPGSIILLHDGGGDRSQTIAAVPMIIEGLRARGYSFTSVC